MTSKSSAFDQSGDIFSPGCTGLTAMAEREIGAFIAVVTDQYGWEQAKLSAEDWINEFLLTDALSISAPRGWREVTVAASARLASRLSETKVSPTPSSNGSGPFVLA